MDMHIAMHRRQPFLDFQFMMTLRRAIGRRESNSLQALLTDQHKAGRVKRPRPNEKKGPPRSAGLLLFAKPEVLHP
jgi:hypothetical protein